MSDPESSATDDAPAGKAAGLRASAAARRRGWRGRRWWRITVWTLRIALGLIALLALLVWLLLASLNRPAVRDRLRAMVRDSSGIDLDYDQLEVSLWSGEINANAIRIASPPPFAEAAPTFLSIGKLHAELNVGALILGDIEVPQVTIERIEIRMVRDHLGRTTLDLLTPPGKETETPPPPPPTDQPRGLSQALAGLPQVWLGELRIDSIDVQLIELAPPAPGAQGGDVGQVGEVARRLSAGTLSINAAVNVDAAGLVAAELRVGPSGSSAGASANAAGAPSDFAIELVDVQGGGATLRARAALAIDVTTPSPRTVAARARIDLAEQNFYPALRPLRTLLDLNAKLELRPEQHQSAASAELALLDGAISANASVELDDEARDGPPVRANARATVALPTLPIELPGVELANAELDATLENLELAESGPTRGSVRVRGGIERLAVERDGTRLADVQKSRISLSADLPGPLRATLAADQLTATPPPAAEQPLARPPARPAETLTASVAGLDVEINVPHAAARPPACDGARDAAATLCDFGWTEGGTVAVRVDRATAAGADVRELTCELRARPRETGGLPAALADPNAPLALAAGAAIRVGAVAVDRPGLRADLSGAAVTVELPQLDVDPRATPSVAGRADGRVDIANLRARVPGQRVVTRDLSLSAGGDLALRALSGAVRAGQLQLVSGGQTKELRGVDLTWETAAPLQISPSAKLAKAGEVRAALRGAIAKATLNPKMTGSVSGLDVTVDRTGALQYGLRANAQLSSRRLPDPVALTARGELDLAAPALNLHVSAVGAAGPDVNASATARVEGTQLSYRIELGATRLRKVGPEITALVPAAADLAWHGAELALSASGEFDGLLRRGRPRRGSTLPPLPELAPGDPMRGMAGSQTARIELRGLDYKTAQLGAQVPAITVNLSSHHRRGGAGEGQLDIQVPSVNLRSGRDSVAASGFREQLAVTFVESPMAGTFTLTSKARIDQASQSYFAAFPVGDAVFAAEIDVDRFQSATIRKLSLVNGASRTRFAASGAVERRRDLQPADREAAGIGAVGAVPGDGGAGILPGRESFTLVGSIEQDAASFVDWGIAERAKGGLAVPFSIESGDLVSFRIGARIKADNVSVQAGDVQVRRLRGTIPVQEEIALLPSGVELIPAPEQNPLTRTRFFDVHPFLQNDNYITAETIAVAGQRFDRLAGNLRIWRSSLAIDQLQVGYRRGTITGQLLADYREAGPQLFFRGNVTGVQPSAGLKRGGGDVLDANAALTFAPRSLALDGKIQIVRIGRAHLLDLLDALDPYRESADVNKVRLGLKLGYPKFMRIQIRDNALDAKVELGGLAAAIQLYELRALPIGPLLEQHVAPLVSPRKAKP